MISPAPEKVRENFDDLFPKYTIDEALKESSRCLYCFDAPCMRACPTRIDIPGFIRQILDRNPVGAAETILSSNILGGSCARACPTEVLCEGACVDNTMLNDPVKIGRLQRYACDTATERGVTMFEPGESTGKKVAIVGGGPAGMACAHEARRLGHEAVIFDANDVPGGLNTLGIAPYKISTEFALTEVELVKKIGVEYRTNSPVDGAKLKELMAEYDAVFLGIGLGKTASLDLPGNDLEGVKEAIDFVRTVHTVPYDKIKVGRRVVVIGGGNTAIDMSTESVSLGAEEVIMVYRRGQDAMPAYAHEQEHAKELGVQFKFFAAPTRFVGENGKLTGVEFQRMELDGEGRSARLNPVAGSEFVVPCDMAIKALGQVALVDFLKEIDGLKLNKKGVIEVDPNTFQTSVAGLYAGGDCTSGGKEIVNAVQEGKLAARAIDKKLRG
ncbi:NAD(P)-dependent oxidoreductase [bacterium]|nr:NAD(P)-dependent oxidoreductase [bacterium]